MSNFTVVYDACVLYPNPLRDLLMQVAVTDLCVVPQHARPHGLEQQIVAQLVVVSGQVGGHEPLPFHLQVSLRTNRRTRFRIVLVEFTSDQLVEKIQRAARAGRQ